MTLFSIALDACDSATSAQLIPVLASVPARFRVTEADADVVVVSGATPDWLDRLEAALHRRARGVFIAHPARADAGRLHTLARAFASTATPVGVAVGYATDRAWRRALPLLKSDLPSAVLLDSVVTCAQQDGDTAVQSALVAQLALLRSLVGSLEEIQVVQRTTEQYVATAQHGNLPMNLTGVASTRRYNTLRLDLIGQQRRWRLRLNADALARPGEIVRFDTTGAHIEPPLYESPHRAALLELHAALSKGSSLGYTLTDLADDLELASTRVAGAISDTSP